MKTIIIILLLVITTPVFAQYKITEYTRDTAMTDDDIVSGANDPDGATPTNAAYTLGALADYINAGAISSVNWSSITGSPLTANWQDLNMYYSGGNVGIGTPIPGRIFDVTTSEVNIARFTSTSASGTGAGTANLRIGTDDGAALSAGDKFVTIDFFGSRDASHNVNSAAGITAYAMSDFSGSNGHSRLDFETTASGSTSRNGRLSINALNVGIGTNLPLARLEVSSTSAYDQFLVNDNYAGDTTPFVITSDGNVGVGSSNPTAKFVVMGSGTSTGAALNVRDSAGTLLTTQLDSGNFGIEASAPTALLDIASTKSQDLFKVQDNGTSDSTPFVIDSTGNVGIGTPIPTAQNANYLVHVFNGSNTNRAIAITNKDTGANAVTRVELVGNDSNGFVQNAHTAYTLAPAWAGKTMLYNEAGNGVIVGSNSTANSIQFMNAATERMRILGANVGIGSTNPNGAFVIRSSSTDIGWTRQTGANTACNTTCVASCVFGQNTADFSIVDCADATADVCICAGSN